MTLLSSLTGVSSMTVGSLTYDREMLAYKTGHFTSDIHVYMMGVFPLKTYSYTYEKSKITNKNARTVQETIEKAVMSMAQSFLCENQNYF